MFDYLHNELFFTCPTSIYVLCSLTTLFFQDEYYDTYFIRSCGGDYGTNPVKRTYRKALKKKAGVYVNITVPKVITGHGGTEEMRMDYVCSENLCSGSGKAYSFSIILVVSTILSMTTALLI